MCAGPETRESSSINSTVLPEVQFPEPTYHDLQLTLPQFR